MQFLGVLTKKWGEQWKSGVGLPKDFMGCQSYYIQVFYLFKL